MPSKSFLGALLLLSQCTACGDASGPSQLEAAATPVDDESKDGTQQPGIGTAAGSQADPDAMSVGEGVSMPRSGKAGVVSLAQIDGADLLPSPVLRGVFQDAPLIWGGCTRYPVGDCYFYECLDGSNPVHAVINTSYPVASAGELEVSGQGTGHPLQQEPSGLYEGVAERLWSSAGTPLLITASGADVPAFAVEVEAPSVIPVTSPGHTPHDPITWDQRSHLPIEWIPGTHGIVRLAIYDTEYALQRPALYCSFPATWGRAVVPSAALLALEVGGPYMLRIVGMQEKRVAVDDWEISVMAVAYNDTRQGVINNMLWLR